MSEEDILYRILLFKVFNRIETWEYLESKVGVLNLKSFDIPKISKLLSDRIASKPIFSSAYLMTGSYSDYLQYSSKHERWLQMINSKFIKEGLFVKIIC